MNKDELVLLLKKYKENKAKLKLKLREKENILRDLESIKSVDLSSSRLEINSDIRSKNSISDRVGNKASENIDKQTELDYKLSEVEAEIKELNSKIEEIDIRIESLTYKEAEIIKDYYIENNTYEHIGNYTYFRLFKQTRSARNIQDIVEKAVNKMLKI